MRETAFKKFERVWSALGRSYTFISFKGCLPQILLGPFLNTLTHIFYIEAHALLRHPLLHIIDKVLVLPLSYNCFSGSTWVAWFWWCILTVSLLHWSMYFLLPIIILNCSVIYSCLISLHSLFLYFSLDLLTCNSSTPFWPFWPFWPVFISGYVSNKLELQACLNYFSLRSLLEPYHKSEYTAVIESKLFF